MHRLLALVSVSLVAAGLSTQVAGQTQTAPVQGIRQNTPTVFALVGAKIVVSPEETIERGNLIVRQGMITDVGPDAKIPADATIVQLEGKTIYAGLIDAFTELPEETEAPKPAGTGYWNENVTPEFHAAEVYRPSKRTNDRLRRVGITARLVAPRYGNVKGVSALVTTGDDGSERAVLADEVAMHLKLTTARRTTGDFPRSPMGALALVRQAFYDAQWYADAPRIYRAHPALARPVANASLVALHPYLVA